VGWSGGTSPGSCKNNNGGSGGGCSAIFNLQPFQQGIAGACVGQRSLPDIALDAVGGQDLLFNGTVQFGGGTSIAAPMLAGFFAQANAYLLHISNITGNVCGTQQAACTPLGWGTPFLYFIGAFPDNAAHYPFYDIKSGCNSNDVTIANNLVSFCAGPGYDNVTGWGSANMLQLAWGINTAIAGDSAPPNVAFTTPNPGQWFNTSQTIQWTVTDVSTTNAKPVGVAGFTINWDADPGDDAKKATPGTGSNFYNGPASPLQSSGSIVTGPGTSGEGCHILNVRAWDNTGMSANYVTGEMCFDNVPPVVSCQSPDGLWHANDVSLACTASDNLSGLANPADATFNLTTSVPAGVETNNASTNSHTVFDVAGNSTAKGPVSGIMVDKKPPAIVISQPTATTYQHTDTLTLNYTVTDGGSGVGTVSPTMNGSSTVGGSPISNGLAIDLLTALPLGQNTFTINASDKVGNAAMASVTFTIVATPMGMLKEIAAFQASGDITGDPSSFLDKLNNAAASRSGGNCTAAGNQYGAFINEVQAQTGKKISAKAAAILIADAQYLITHCP
jgi:hypothetical protein